MIEIQKAMSTLDAIEMENGKPRKKNHSGIQANASQSSQPVNGFASTDDIHSCIQMVCLAGQRITVEASLKNVLRYPGIWSEKDKRCDWSDNQWHIPRYCS